MGIGLQCKKQTPNTIEQEVNSVLAYLRNRGLLREADETHHLPSAPVKGITAVYKAEQGGKQNQRTSSSMLLSGRTIFVLIEFITLSVRTNKNAAILK